MHKYPEAPNFRLVAAIIACALFMQHLDATVIATALPTMARDFKVSAPSMSIALTEYLLALTLFIPASGHAADRWSGKLVFHAAIGVFTFGSIGCALAPNLGTLGVARFVQGIGGAMMVPVGRLVLIRTVEKRDLLAAQAWLVMPGVFGQILGPPIGGLIVSYFDWRYIFWINVPIGLLGMYLVRRHIPAQAPLGHRPFDRRGFVLSGVALTTLVFGLESLGRGSHVQLASLSVAFGIACSVLYVVHARSEPHPMLDLKLLRLPTFRLSMIGGSLVRIMLGALPFLLPLMMQLAFGLRAAQSGLVTVGTAVGSMAMKALSPVLLRRLGFRLGLTLMGALSALACAACSLFRPGWPLVAIFACLMVLGFLMSFLFTAYNTIAYDEVSPDQLSGATSFYFTIQQLTITLGVCTGASLLHFSMAAGHRSEPAFADFSVAFLVVGAIALCAIFANMRFHPRAGHEISQAP